MNALFKNRPGTSQMSEQFGPNFAPGSFALQQSIRLVYTLRALSGGRNRATRATRDNQMYTHTERAHTRSATETKHNSQPETPKGSWPLLLPRRRHRHRHRRRCCCCAAAVVTHGYLFSVFLKNMLCFDASRSFLFSIRTRFVFFGDLNAISAIRSSQTQSK